MTAASPETAFPRTGISGPIDWLCLAATPTFAIMALLTQAHGGGPLDALCAGAGSRLGGMTVMYVLMSAFHTPPWLRLIGRRRNGQGS